MLLYWEDAIYASGLQPGMYGYGGYFNGPFANLTAIRGRFPGKPVMGYALRVAGMSGADAIDCEPGTVDLHSPYPGTSLEKCQRAALDFVRSWDGGGGLFSRPLVYCFASWMTPMETYLTANGAGRARYFLNSSHATGTAHFCGPGTCGFGRSVADMTQYKFAGDYDRSVSQGYMLAGAGGDPVPAPPKMITGQVLRQGDAGTAVLRVQQRLFNLRYLPTTQQCDGQFGPVTALAVAAFQKTAGLAADGIVGPQTWAALSNNLPNPAYKPPPPPSPRPVLPPPVLRPGMTGTGVKSVQWYLANSGLKGVRGIAQDGDYGDQTTTAVRNFQGYSKLTTDGVYGPDTRTALARVHIP